MRARLALLLLPLVGALFLVRPRPPSEVPVRVHLGARGAQVRQLELKFERGESIVRDVTLRFPDGAPAEVERTVRLAPGDYRIAIRVLDALGHEARDARAQRIDRDDPVELDVERLP